MFAKLVADRGFSSQWLGSKRLGKKASVSVELAMVSIFFLLPLLGGGADFVSVINAQSQMNTALDALYYYAWNTPSNAENPPTSLVDSLNAHSLSQISFKAVESFDCGPGTPLNSACSTSQTERIFVTYTLTSNAFVPVPIPFVFSSANAATLNGVSGNGYALTTAGTIQIQ